MFYHLTLKRPSPRKAKDSVSIMPEVVLVWREPQPHYIKSFQSIKYCISSSFMPFNKVFKIFSIKDILALRSDLFLSTLSFHWHLPRIQKLFKTFY